MTGPRSHHKPRDFTADLSDFAGTTVVFTSALTGKPAPDELKSALRDLEQGLALASRMLPSRAVDVLAVSRRALSRFEEAERLIASAPSASPATITPQLNWGFRS